MNNYLKYLESIQSPSTFKRKIEYLKHNFSKFVTNNSVVLEIGPGLGEFIFLLNQRHINDIDIIDYDKSVIKHIEKKYKIEHSYNQDISVTKLKRKYDLIFLLQVLEHIPPKKYPDIIKNLYGSLNQKGKIIITVPNGGNPLGIVERYSDITHYNLFSDNSLIQLPNYCNLPDGYQAKVLPYSIPPSNILNIFRIVLQKILHNLINLTVIINDGVYSHILTPNITCIITKTK